MTLAARALALVLAALVALTGASLDLCACTPGDHGPLCAASDDAHAAAAPPVVAEADEAPHGCCSGADAPDPGEPTVGAADCACPLVALEAPVSAPPEAAAAAAPERVGLDLAPPPAGDLARVFVAEGAGRPRAPPWTPPRRRHLELHVLRL